MVSNLRTLKPRFFLRGQNLGGGCLKLKALLHHVVSRDDGNLNKVPVPSLCLCFVAAAVAVYYHRLAGPIPECPSRRPFSPTSPGPQLAAKDYAHLEKAAH
jgi:hypothetical protein